jgi:hypothetical protein
MSSRLSASVLALGILVGAMGLKTVVTTHAQSSPVLAAKNGPDPMPGRPTRPPSKQTLAADQFNGPDPMPGRPGRPPKK